MFIKKIIHPLLFLVISIILFVKINKNNLFKNDISNINNKYDNILNIIFNSISNNTVLDNNIQDNKINNIFNNNQNKTLSNIQNNNINNDLYERTVENFEIPGEGALKNIFKKGVTKLESVASSGLKEIGSEIVKDVLPVDNITQALELSEQEKQLIYRYQRNPIKDKKYKLAIDKKSKCDDPTLNYLTYYNGASLYDNLIKSCVDENNKILTQIPVCQENCGSLDTVYKGSINEDIVNLKQLKEKLENILDGKKTALAKILKTLNSESSEEKSKYLKTITSLRAEVKNLTNYVSGIVKEEKELQKDNLNQSQTIKNQSKDINNLNSDNASLVTKNNLLAKDTFDVIIRTLALLSISIIL